MRVLFRTDASVQIGTGHVMRCLTLATLLASRGAHCRFICRDHPGNLVAAIRERGFEVDVLADTPGTSPVVDEPPHASWLGTDWQSDAKQCAAKMPGPSIDWLVVDHYALDAKWESALRSKCKRLMVIDDLVDRPHDCDVLLNQNLGSDRSDYAALTPSGCDVLTGTRYALIRPEFVGCRAASMARRATPKLRHLLITMGGIDKDNFTGKVLAALAGCALPGNCTINVMLGPSAPSIDAVVGLSGQMPWRTEVIVNAGNVAALMSDADLAIGAAGSTAWERCVLGLPSLMAILADNQAQAGAHLAATGAAQLLERGPAFRASLQEAVKRLLVGPDELTRMSRCAAAVCDGNGAQLLANRLFA